MASVGVVAVYWRNSFKCVCDDFVFLHQVSLTSFWLLLLRVDGATTVQNVTLYLIQPGSPMKWRLSEGQNPRHSVQYARNIPLDQNDHFSAEAVTGLYRRYRYNSKIGMRKQKQQ
ncbi:hypothetical protein TNCV_1298041 [Trichonephila clavipes]|nr:hypothetical protein TNCV_1298041 [Trichonephila clavipes]